MKRTNIAWLAVVLIGCGGNATTDPGESEDLPDVPGDVEVCPFSDPADPSDGALVWIRGNDVVLVLADGSETVPYTFTAGVGADSAQSSNRARGGFIAVRRTFKSLEKDTVTSEIALLTRKGAVLWSAVLDEGTYWDRLGETGTYVVVLDKGTRVYWPDGSSEWVPGVAASGAPDAEGMFPAQFVNPDIAAANEWKSGWIKPGDPIQLTPIPAAFGCTMEERDGAFYYVAEQAPGSASRMLVRATLDDTKTWPLPEAASNLSWFPDLEPPYVLLQRNDLVEGPAQLVDMMTGEVVQVGIAPGLTPFGWLHPNAALKEDGSVWRTLRDDSVGAFFRTTDQGASWEQVGKSLSHVTLTSVRMSGNTAVLEARDDVDIGYPWADPGPGEKGPDVKGPIEQVIRLDLGVSWDLPASATWFSLNAKGSCFAYADQGRVFAMTTATGESVDLGALGEISGGISWIE